MYIVIVTNQLYCKIMVELRKKHLIVFYETKDVLVQQGLFPRFLYSIYHTEIR